MTFASAFIFSSVVAWRGNVIFFFNLWHSSDIFCPSYIGGSLFRQCPPYLQDQNFTHFLSTFKEVCNYLPNYDSWFSFLTENYLLCTVPEKTCPTILYAHNRNTMGLSKVPKIAPKSSARSVQANLVCVSEHNPTMHIVSMQCHF